jgi:trimeric autotransporter adhesin
MVPDRGDCFGPGVAGGGCWTITNTSSNATHSAIRGDGIGTGASGIWGTSASSNGVRGYTSSSTNAAISALSPSSTGLAYWGTGNLTISGSTGTKAGGGTWAVLSDGQLKKDVKDFRTGFAGLEKIRPVTFKYNGLAGTENNGREHVGVIAQELEKVFPSMVSTQKRKLNEGDAKEVDVKVVDGNALTYMLINAVKEQQEIIETQGRRISALEQPRATFSPATLGGGLGLCLVFGLLPAAFVASRRRKGSPVNDA